MDLTVMNYELKPVPYSLGSVVLYSYAVCYAFPPATSESLSFIAYLYVVGIWLLGLIDDIFGKPFPKGLKGHILYAKKKRVITTGLLKAIGTAVLALMYIAMNEPSVFMTSMLSFLLLTGFPHVMNLFDTRPLRVWKAALCITLFLFAITTTISFIFVITIVAAFYITFVLEGHRKAMLGDNGATVVGAIFAIIFIQHTEQAIQIGALIVMFFIILLSEKWSISALIERSSLLRAIDQIGISRNHD